MQTIEAAGYSHWASALINGDRSGLNDTDVAELNAWLEWHGVTAEQCFDCTTEEFFGWPTGPASMLKGTLVVYRFWAPDSE